MELLQTELSDSKQEVEHFKSQLLKLQEYNILMEKQLRVICISYYFKNASYNLHYYGFIDL